MTKITYNDALYEATEYFGGDELAGKVFVDKYALRDGNNDLLESSPDQMHHRLAKEFARIESKYPNPLSEDEIYQLLSDFKWVVPQGSPMSAIGNIHKVQSTSNCFVVDPPYDSYGGICYTDQHLVQIAKRRGGIGFDISNIRPKGSNTANAAGTTDGIGIFMERYSNSCREVAQNGRRGALLLSISCHHPEIRTFINIKKELTKVTGANISIRWSDEFLQAVENNEKVELRWPVDSTNPEITEQVDAQEIWNEFVDAAWTSAEPGCLFWDTAIKRTPSDIYVDEGFGSTSTNPCVVGDTLVAVADGRNAVAIKTLVDEGKAVPVYSTNPTTGQVEIKKAFNFIKTGEKKEVWRLELDDGSELIATPNHRILTKELKYVELKDLKPGESLAPFNSFNSNGYRQICHSGKKMMGGARRNASHPGETNGRYSGYTNEELLEHGRKVFEEKGQFTIGLWQEYAKTHKMPQYVGGQFRFGKFSNFKSQVVENHKVVSVGFYGHEDVYDCTVEDNHNFCIITSFSDEDYISSSGITIHNCGEIILSNKDSCRLMLINTYSFVKNRFTDVATFDFEGFGQCVQKAQRLMDDMIDLEIEAINRVIAKIKNDPEPDEVKQVELDLWTNVLKAAEKGRRTGLGVNAIGDTIAALGHRYGSAESIDIVEQIYKTLALNAYKSSCVLASERGAFPVYSYKKEVGHPFIEQLFEADPELRSLHKKFGRRNIALTTTAPSGSVSVLTQTSSGIEPVFMTHYTRRKKINPSEKDARVDFIDDLGDKWQEFTVYHHGIKEWMKVSGQSDISLSPYAGATANEIDWEAAVDLQAAAQKWLCHAISKTTNLPNSVDKEVVDKVYMRGWKSGCKGITVYRDGCRSGVLVTKSEEPKEKDGRPTHITHVQSPKRPDELPCEIHHATVKGTPWTVLFGMMNETPYEVFMGYSENISLPKRCQLGKIIKINKGRYDLHVDIGGDEPLIVKDIIKTFDNPESAWATRMISLSLRHGVPLEFVIDQLNKDGAILDVNKVLSRILKKFIRDGAKVKSNATCPKCGSDSLVYMEGCVTCSSCGWSRC